MSEQLTCTQCGDPITAIVARRLKGLCLRCKMKLTETNPFYLLNDSLITRVHKGPGFGSLTEAEKIYYAVNLFMNEVNNGGFHQYFFNSSGSYYEYAEKGLTTLGETQTLALLHAAKEIVFPTTAVPANTETRRKLIPLIEPGAPVPEWSRKLDQLDKRFYKESSTLTSKLKTFARRQGLVPAQAEDEDSTADTNA